MAFFPLFLKRFIDLIGHYMVKSTADSQLDHDGGKQEFDDDLAIIKDLHMIDNSVSNTVDQWHETVVAVYRPQHDPEDDKKERRRGFYTNRQKILLVGEGDFSFASCLATAFGTASNLVATSLDSRDTVVTSYSGGERNLRDLKERSALVIHQVDVHTMDKHPQLRHKFFDRIVFNFPHASGSYPSVKETDSWFIMCHQGVVSGFFKAARNMVTVDGEIHVTHKTAYPYDRWNIVGLAEKAGLALKRKPEFKIWDYPGYVNKKAYRSSRYRCNWDSTFPVGKCSTFMFSAKYDL